MFEKIEYLGNGKRGGLAIYRPGMLGIPCSVMEKCHLEKGQTVNFYFDKDTSRLAIKNNSTTGAKIGEWGKGRSGIISIRRICTNFSIVIPQKIYDFDYNTNGYALIFKVERNEV